MMDIEDKVYAIDGFENKISEFRKHFRSQV